MCLVALCCCLGGVGGVGVEKASDRSLSDGLVGL